MRLFSSWPICLVILISWTSASTDSLWLRWKNIHGKAYDDEEDTRRRDIWERTVQEVQQHNLFHDLGMVSYTLGLNQFADMTFDEIRDRYLSTVRLDLKATSRGTPYEVEEGEIPDSIDWRNFGLVTGVKDQGNCASYWAFATTGVVEGQYAKKYGQIREFSEQQLMDCSFLYSNRGCQGGLIETSYEYLKEESLYEEEQYPYRENVGRCFVRESGGVLRVTGYLHVHDGNETRLQAMVGQRGPVGVLIDAEKDFFLYKGGIYQSKRCFPGREFLDHAVLIVGYGKEKDQEYWIAKNSWGSNWGEGGYIRIVRNKHNMCGVATLASIANVIATNRPKDRP